jgi:hypothetical protein
MTCSIRPCHSRTNRAPGSADPRPYERAGWLRLRRRPKPLKIIGPTRTCPAPPALSARGSGWSPDRDRRTLRPEGGRPSGEGGGSGRGGPARAGPNDSASAAAGPRGIVSPTRRVRLRDPRRQESARPGENRRSGLASAAGRSPQDQNATSYPSPLSPLRGAVSLRDDIGAGALEGDGRCRRAS